MTPRRAAIFFGLKLEGLTPDNVREAFQLTIKNAHPDTPGTVSDPAKHIADAKSAKTALMAYLNARAGECTKCDGSGRLPIRGTLQTIRCGCK